MSEKTDPTLNTLRLIDTAVNGLTALFASEAHRVDERFSMFSTYIKDMGIAESKRIDAIREVDATAVRVANDRAIEQAGVLANQVATSAETQRALVATTAAVVATNLQQVAGQLADRIEEQAKQQQLKDNTFTKSIGDLQKFQNENQGKSSLSTPLLMMISGVIVGVIVFIVESLIRMP